MIWMELHLIASWSNKLFTTFWNNINYNNAHNIYGDIMKKMLILMAGMAIGYVMSGCMSNACSNGNSSCNSKMGLNQFFKKMKN